MGILSNNPMVIYNCKKQKKMGGSNDTHVVRNNISDDTIME
jgi:hypothetical protein